jgi:hypothetical protein
MDRATPGGRSRSRLASLAKINLDCVTARSYFPSNKERESKMRLKLLALAWASAAIAFAVIQMIEVTR